MWKQLKQCTNVSQRLDLIAHKMYMGKQMYNTEGLYFNQGSIHCRWTPLIYLE